jgi:hypothetical protein
MAPTKQPQRYASMELSMFRRLLVLMTGLGTSWPAAGQDAGVEKGDLLIAVGDYTFADDEAALAAAVQRPLVPLAIPPAMVQGADPRPRPPAVPTGWQLGFNRGGVVVEGGGSPAARGVSLGATVDPGANTGRLFLATRSADLSIGSLSARSTQQLVFDQPQLFAKATPAITLKHTIEVDMPWYDTSLMLDSIRSGSDDSWLHRLEARQTLLGPVDVGVLIEETSPHKADIGLSTRLRLDW